MEYSFHFHNEALDFWTNRSIVYTSFCFNNSCPRKELGPFILHFTSGMGGSPVLKLGRLGVTRHFSAPIYAKSV